MGPEMMRAAVVTGYGGPDRVRVEMRPVPVPGAGQVLIRVMATTVSSADWRIRSQTLPRGFGLFGRLAFGLRRPRQPVLGTECAGVVTATGAGVSGFRPGDAVVAYAGAAMGCHAEQVAVPVTKVIAKPPALTWEEAAAMSFGGCTALTFLRAGGLAAGQRVLVLGATGTVGSAAVQIAHAAGATVTATGRAGDHNLLHALRADAVIDNRAGPLTGQWEVILDAVGAATWPQIRPHLTADGRFLMVAADLAAMLAARFVRGSPRPLSVLAPERAEDMAELALLADRGLYRPLIDSSFALDDIAAAHARTGSGHKRGAVVVRVGLETGAAGG